MEQKTWWKAITYPERIDYVSFQYNELVFVLAIEKLLALEVPRKATWMRTLLCELNAHPLAPDLARDGRARAGRDLAVLVLLPRARPDPRPVRDGLRDAHAHALLPGRRARRGHSARLLPGVPQVRRVDAEGDRRVRGDARRGTRSGSSARRASGCSPPTDAIALGQSGPVLRASGVDWDLRRDKPYLAYRRGRVRRARLPERRRLRPLPRAHGRDARVGADRRAVPGREMPRGRGSPTTARSCCRRAHELHTSMESLIHHFKIVTEGFRVPEGEVYVTVESPRGELGCYVVSDGGPKPWRVKFRAPSFVALEATATCMHERARRRPDRDRRLARHGHGRGRPMTRACATEIREAARSAYPDRRSAIMPALRLAQERNGGWLPPEALARSPTRSTSRRRYSRRSRPSTTCTTSSRSGEHLVEVCTNISCALVGAQQVVEAFEQELGVRPARRPRTAR